MFFYGKFACVLKSRMGLALRLGFSRGFPVLVKVLQDLSALGSMIHRNVSGVPLEVYRKEFLVLGLGATS